ncbi:hypothetical protein AAMO2058_000205400 [Amorphochlora amoebiformis]
MTSAFDQTKTFSTMGLDRRIFKAVATLGFVHPTLVQAACIPTALEGRDIMAKAETGSGKTMAFAVPVVQAILNEKGASEAPTPGLRAVILVPTKELCDQVTHEITKLLRFCRDIVSVMAVSSAVSRTVQIPRLLERPDIIVATPGRLMDHLRKNSIAVDEEVMQLFVIDEADLVLSYGYEEDVKAIIDKLPRRLQTILMSATLSPEVEALEKLVLSKPAVFKFENSDSAKHNQLQQFYYKCRDIDKYLVLYAMIKLRLIPRRSLIFVNSVERCFKLKLFLEQFSVSTAVLNAELPYNSRCNIISHFHKGAFGYLLATDASVELDEKDTLHFQEDSSKEEAEDEFAVFDNTKDKGDKKDVLEDAPEESEQDLDEEEEEEDFDDDEEGEYEKVDFEFQMVTDSKEDSNPEVISETKNHKNVSEEDAKKQKEEKSKSEKSEKESRPRKRMRKGGGEEYGVARGVDFKNVATVVNFDFPLSIKNYVHRVGRTARGGASGSALSLVADHETELLASLVAHQIEKNRSLTTDPKADIEALEISLADIEGFRYRVGSVLKSVTRSAVREARLKELRMEVVNSQKLKAHFEDNPRELALLKHAKVLRPTKVQPALKHVPSYLIPANSKASVVNDVRNSSRKRRRGPPSRDTASSGRSYSRNYRKQGDPLKTFAFGDSKPSEGMILAMAGKSESQKRRAARNDLRQRKRISARKRKPDRNKMAKLGMKGRRR